MLKKSISLLLVITLLLTAGLIGCSKNTSQETTDNQNKVAEQIQDEGQKDATDVQKQESDEEAPNPAKARDTSDALVVGVSGDFKGQFISPYNTTTYDAYVMRMCFSPLLTYNREGELVPVVAERYEVSEDKKTFTFYLRKDVEFSDGKPLTAKDVAFTYHIFADPSYDGRGVSVVQDMVGYEEYYNDAEGKIKSMSGIKVIDDYTISFTFKEAIRNNIENFTTHILPEHYYGFEKGHTDELKAKQHEVLGSGPYNLVKFEPGQYIELAVNENYFGEKKPQIQRVILKVTEHSTEAEELVSGQIDMLAGVIEPEKLEQAKDAGFIDFYQYPRAGYGYLKFNCMEEPTNDKRVRQALVYGFNRKGFVDSFFQGLAVTQDVPMAQTSWAYTKELKEKLTNYDYNPEKAAQLLDEAGWKLESDGYRYKDGKKLSIHLLSIAELEMWEMVTGLMAENYKQLGVDVKISLMDFNSMITKVYDEREGFNMYSMAVGWTTPEPGVYTGWHSKFDVPGGDNTARYHNDLNDELLEKARREFDIEKAKKLYEEWALNINEDIPILILYANLYTDLVNNRIKGYSPSAIYDFSKDIVNMYIEE